MGPMAHVEVQSTAASRQLREAPLAVPFRPPLDQARERSTVQWPREGQALLRSTRPRHWSSPIWPSAAKRIWVGCPPSGSSRTFVTIWQRRIDRGGPGHRRGSPPHVLSSPSVSYHRRPPGPLSLTGVLGHRWVACRRPKCASGSGGSCFLLLRYSCSSALGYRNRKPREPR